MFCLRIINIEEDSEESLISGVDLRYASAGLDLQCYYSNTQVNSRFKMIIMKSEDQKVYLVFHVRLFLYLRSYVVGFHWYEPHQFSSLAGTQQFPPKLVGHLGI